jgi:hypothetical protein
VGRRPITGAITIFEHTNSIVLHDDPVQVRVGGDRILLHAGRLADTGRLSTRTRSSPGQA